MLTQAVETPAVVYEMKKQVDLFREKLEVNVKASGFVVVWLHAIIVSANIVYLNILYLSFLFRFC